MRTAAVVMGLLAGGLGLVLSLLTPFLGERAFWMLGISMVALLGAALTRGRPSVGTGLMLGCAVAGMLAVLWLWIVPAVLLLTAGILAMMDRRSPELRPT